MFRDHFPCKLYSFSRMYDTLRSGTIITNKGCTYTHMPMPVFYCQFLPITIVCIELLYCRRETWWKMRDSENCFSVYSPDIICLSLFLPQQFSFHFKLNTFKCAHVRMHDLAVRESWLNNICACYIYDDLSHVMTIGKKSVRNSLACDINKAAFRNLSRVCFSGLVLCVCL